MTENKNKTIKELRYIHKRCDNEGRYSECDALENAICAIEENQQYHAIGTVEELQALKEKAEPKKPNYEGDGYYNGELVLDTWICPNCGKSYEVDYDNYDYCPNCGQNIDHSSLTEDD